VKNSTTTSLSFLLFFSKPNGIPEFKISAPEFSHQFFSMLLQVIDESIWHKLSLIHAINVLFKTIFKH
tara:strand:- start:7056 stop:7259 length:204 start_codon:yes stop_codon:yes gene_type:complete